MPQDSEAEAVMQANQGFYRAFQSLDIDQMVEVWVHAESVKCVHPGWALLQGWEPVMESWERIFDNADMMQFAITGAEVTLEGESAWVTCTENITSVMGGRSTEGRVQAINIYRKLEERWLMVYHHGSPMM